MEVARGLDKAGRLAKYQAEEILNGRSRLQPLGPYPVLSKIGQAEWGMVNSRVGAVFSPCRSIAASLLFDSARFAPLWNVSRESSCCRAMKAPCRGESVGGFFDVEDFAPRAVTQKCMSKLVSNHVKRKGLGAMRQLWSQHDATSPAADRAWSWHPQRPTLTGYVVVDGHSEPRIFEEILLNVRRNRMEHCKNSLTQFGEIGQFDNQ